MALARAQVDGEIDRTLESYRPIELEVLRIGEAWLVGLPGEVFAEYALRIKRSSPGRTFVASLVGGELGGYLVTPEAAAGTYEATTSLFAPEAGRVMVEVVLAMIRGEKRGAGNDQDQAPMTNEEDPVGLVIGAWSLDIPQATC